MSIRRSIRLSSSSMNSDLSDNAESNASANVTTMPPPATPSPRKRRKPNGIDPPPITPTPSAIKLMTAPSLRPSSTLETPEATSQTSPSQTSPSNESPTKKPRARKARAAQPHKTNAPLQTPRGSKVIADPTQTAVANNQGTVDEDGEALTTENLLIKAEAYLIQQDPRFKALIEAQHCRIFSPEGLAENIDPFQSLVSGICGQQVSSAAATSIRNKFIGLFNENGQFPTPDQVVKTDLAHLRTAGLSARKAEYIQGLAEKFVSGELTAMMLANASDAEVLEKLVAVRGLGRWSVEMFACFGLKRMDIFSTGDLGVQRGIAVYLGKDVAKLKSKGGKWKYCSEEQMLEVASKFIPYRSLFMWYMWRASDANVDIFQNQ